MTRIREEEEVQNTVAQR